MRRHRRAGKLRRFHISIDVIVVAVRVDNMSDLKVTGVLKDLPDNSSFQFNFIIPFSYYAQNTYWVKQSVTSWSNNPFQTFVALQPNASYAEVESKMKLLVKKYNPEGNGQLVLESLPIGSRFKWRNGKIFEKAAKIRKRYRCIEVKSKRVWFFHPMAEIEKV